MRRRLLGSRVFPPFLMCQSAVCCCPCHQILNLSRLRAGVVKLIVTSVVGTRLATAPGRALVLLLWQMQRGASTPRRTRGRCASGAYPTAAGSPAAARPARQQVARIKPERGDGNGLGRCAPAAPGGVRSASTDGASPLPRHAPTEPAATHYHRRKTMPSAAQRQHVAAKLI